MSCMTHTENDLRSIEGSWVNRAAAPWLCTASQELRGSSYTCNPFSTAHQLGSCFVLQSAAMVLLAVDLRSFKNNLSSYLPTIDTSESLQLEARLPMWFQRAARAESHDSQYSVNVNIHLNILEMVSKCRVWFIHSFIHSWERPEMPQF